MGQEIFYCSRCQIRLRSHDFEHGTGFRSGALVYCKKCVPEEVRATSVPETPKRKGETSRILFAEPPPSSSRRLAIPAQPNAGRQLGAFAAVAAIVLALIAWMVVASRSERPAVTVTPPAPPPVPERTVVVPPPPAPVVPPAPPPVKGGETALRKARDYVRSNPSDYSGQVELYEQALPELQGTPGLDEAKRELDSVRKTGRE